MTDSGPHEHDWTPWWTGASGNRYRACRDLCCDDGLEVIAHA